MSDSSVEKLMSLLKPRLDRLGLKENDIQLDDNLVEAGVFDSVAFLEFTTELEEQTGVEIDFSEMDPEEFTTIQALSAYFFGNQP